MNNENQGIQGKQGRRGIQGKQGLPGIFGERMTRVETDIKYIKESVSETNKKLDKFIDSADSKYAEKDVENRVLAVESEVKGINVTLAKYIGGVAVIFFILQLVLNYILK